ncbi:hypothetical protein OH76DRAFT_1406950 [Lentinus brumalis]|uniref:WDR59/RTC1-like RING zinc finger domain-containing protein n=1 Tax=Lentinus brumalis TaxID=2498619 RepID=A0A371D1P0_9APHY|nr:hypothetical protein OH76DRAFT_1406950 [Polyporus brumalis]
MGSGSFLGTPASNATTIRPDVVEPPSPEDDGTSFKRDAQIDMRYIMGDAVGNMSISPDNGSLVLAARQGLFIMALDDPYRQPRSIPQGGTWDVADVQWNPHLSHSEYIVSTSSEKLLIWNLLLGGRTAIEHVLRSHYRAITDINWHTIEPDVVISTGIDSWQWAWDLRTVHKPIMGLCAFGPAGTQVKWNRVDGNILASSHANEVLIWDRRKGSLPIQRIRAHGAKIYGIDWAHDRRNELVTCSLDKTIKIWDTQTAQPSTVINTTYPVWRARDLPFGQGVLSLPQRGETALEMYAHEDPTTPIEKFAGHDDVVKEFVWRRGGEANNEFQLITWSKDKTLRFWPVDSEVIEKAGVTPTRTITMAPSRRDTKSSFSSRSEGSDPPTFSAPFGNRSILAGVRAPPYHRPVRFATRESSGRTKAAKDTHEDHYGTPRSKPIPAMASSVMSRGPPPSGRSARISPFQWLSNVQVGVRREGSSDTGSGGDSGNVSKTGSKSRTTSLLDPSRIRDRSLSLDRIEDDPALTLQEEITSVVKVLNSPKLKLEKADFSGKKRTCTFGLQGPWGESTSVFLRITFAFPREYPQARHPDGTPTVDLERTPLISMKQRAFILRRLRDIRERERPCLGKCLKFLLFGDQQADSGLRAPLDSESSSEDEAPARRDPASSLLKGDKNLAEPRTSQGVFSANGQLVCFFRAPPRIVRNPLREISMSPSIAARAPDAAPRLFQSPALLSDAVKLLSSAAQDVEPQSEERKRGDDTSNGNNVLRIMDNLFTFSQPALSRPSKPRRVSDNSRQVGDDYALLSSRRSSVYIKSAEGILGIPDMEAANRYVFYGREFADICKTNASVARLLGRSDHERVFRMLHVMSSRRSDHDVLLVHGGVDPLLAALSTRLYEELLGEKDIQMLVFLSVLLLKSFPQENERSRATRDLSSASPSPGMPIASRKISMEYFDPRRPRNRQSSPFSPPTSTPPTPSHGTHGGALHSPSSKGSWSSLFNASSMRQLVSGVRTTTGATSEGTKQSGSVGSRRAIIQREPARHSSGSPLAKASWEATDTLDGSVLPLGSKRRPTFSQVLSGRSTLSEKRHIVFHPSAGPRKLPPLLSPEMRAQLMCHILAYAEMLLAWQLPEKRGELLKLVEDDVQGLIPEPVIEDETLYAAPIGYLRPCVHCGQPGDPSITKCELCNNRRPARCTVCRLTIKGLYHACSKCLHVSHMRCWTAREDPSCASGCGCICALPAHHPLANGMVMVSPMMPTSANAG